MTHALRLSRRSMLKACLSSAAVLPVAAHAQGMLDASSEGLVGNLSDDQSELVRSILERASAAGQSVRLPTGTIRISALDLPGNVIVEGVPGQTEIAILPDGSGLRIADMASVVLRDIAISGGTNALTISNSSEITLERCRFSDADVGVSLSNAGARIRDCTFDNLGDAAIHSMDSLGLLITGNRIDGCGNAGIRIWRSESGSDGTIISSNRIANVDWVGGGNGQNGNGVNVFKADEVIIADNHIADCAFTAVRLNGTRNSQISGNMCLRSGEVAIFSEFEFSGSIIANNIVDTAATGISITNFDVGGALAVCSANIVRNILPVSAVNPDTLPIGIFAEADTAISGNTVTQVPGVAIAAGYGAFLRNVVITANVVTESNYGIGVSVVEGAGKVRIGDNVISSSAHDVVGMAWDEVVETDLAVNAARYANVIF
ncbi:MAG: TIGR03808 family TAT-translocated repetitive protein [Candidatus Devosia phytovorans]|uniref:TIGR03808 family TAT-translocated repetitive protein n=1 Tax=Candidatus Devosia phytovorans TaxID=3121372 RepID=A0AAJ6AYE0_9HYPH|nr:TIGR03808 family TAT-translocated repetitive protein [Devosia sp.]WEK02827.1 MAG: TIGR03808 family TAT-translocated repetitive protein [Devosia sp.]